LPLNVVGPVLVIVVPATTEAESAVPKVGLATDHAGLVLKATIMAPATTVARPPLTIHREFLIAWCFIELLPFQMRDVGSPSEKCVTTQLRSGPSQLFGDIRVTADCRNGSRSENLLTQCIQKAP
jgi:hypothetical protein